MAVQKRSMFLLQRASLLRCKNCVMCIFIFNFLLNFCNSRGKKSKKQSVKASCKLLANNGFDFSKQYCNRTQHGDVSHNSKSSVLEHNRHWHQSSLCPVLSTSKTVVKTKQQHMWKHCAMHKALCKLLFWPLKPSTLRQYSGLPCLPTKC